MKIALIHDSKIYIKNNEFFSAAGFSDLRLRKYKKFFNKIQMVCRGTKTEMNVSKFTKITEQDIEIKLIPNLRSLLKKSERLKIENGIKESDGTIILLPSFLGLLGVYYSQKLKKEYMVELIGCPKDSLKNRSLIGKIIAFPMYLATKYSVYNAKFCLYVTNNFLQKRYPTSGKSVGVSDVILSQYNKNILEKRKKKIDKLTLDQKIIIGTLGAIDVEYKGQEYVIKALSKINENIEYQIVGSGNKMKLEKKVLENKVKNKVKFIGSLPHEEIFEWLDNIDIYIQPSKTEGLPRALVEAMSRGCFCLGSDIGGIPELLDKDCLFKVGDIVEIREKILKVSKNNLYEQAERNYEKSKKFDSNFLGKKRNLFYEKFYKSLERKK